MKLRPTLPLALYTVFVLIMGTAAVQSSLMFGLGHWISLVWSIVSLVWLNFWYEELRRSMRCPDDRPADESSNDRDEP